MASAAAVLCSVASAQAAETSAVSAKAGGPEEDDKPFLIRPFLAMDVLSLELSNGDTDVAFEPNTQLAVGLRVGYGAFSISASVDVEASEDTSTYGKTEYLALQAGRAFRVADRELFVSLFLQYHEGLYVESASGLGSSQLPIVLPEMTVVSLGATVTYYLNPEFSYDATFVEFRPRAESVGSWTLRMSTGIMGFDNAGAPVIPEALRPEFGDVGTLNQSAAAYVGAMGGYSVDLRFWSRCFFAASLLIGATVAREAYTTDLGVEREGSFAPSALFGFALGYAGDTLHAGLATSADLEGSQAGDAEQSIIRTAVGVFVGVRF